MKNVVRVRPVNIPETLSHPVATYLTRGHLLRKSKYDSQEFTMTFSALYKVYGLSKSFKNKVSAKLANALISSYKENYNDFVYGSNFKDDAETESLYTSVYFKVNTKGQFIESGPSTSAYNLD